METRTIAENAFAAYPSGLGGKEKSVIRRID